MKLSSLIEIVTYLTGYSRDELASNVRTKDILIPRCALIYTARHIYHFQNASIARALDCSTVSVWKSLKTSERVISLNQPTGWVDPEPLKWHIQQILNHAPHWRRVR